MSKVLRCWLSALLCAALNFARPAAALELITSIDLNYTYSQENADGDVKAKTEYNQKYEVKYQTSLTSAYDLVGAVRLDLQDAWSTNDPGTSKVTPTLELEAKGAGAAAKITYEGVVSTTDAYRETGEVKTYSTNLVADLQVTPVIWPEAKLKLQRKHDFQPWTADSTSDTIELSLQKDFSNLRVGFNLKLQDDEKLLPIRGSTNGVDWSGKATYKEILWGGTEFELGYDVTENYTEEESRGVFVSETSTYTQQLQTRLKNSLFIGPRMSLEVAWEYKFDQDLLKLDHDYKFQNKYLLDLRWDMMEWLKVTGAAQRETDTTAAVVGEEDQQTLTDTLRAGFDLVPSPWLRLAGKAEFKSAAKIATGTGGSVDESTEEKFELNAKNTFGGFWDLSLDATTSTQHEAGWIKSRETKLNAEAKITLTDLTMTSTYGTTRRHEWEWGFDDPSAQQQSRDGKFKLEYKARLGDLISASFSHEYGIKVDDELDEVLNFERTLQLTESTRLNVLISELIRDLRLEGEIERKGSDTEDDPDPELVEVSYAFKFDWKLDDLTLASSVKYNDKGGTFDDLSFNARVGWRGERFDLAGEYQFDKIYAEVTDEKRKLNLKLNYKF